MIHDALCIFGHDALCEDPGPAEAASTRTIMVRDDGGRFLTRPKHTGRKIVKALRLHLADISRGGIDYVELLDKDARDPLLAARDRQRAQIALLNYLGLKPNVRVSGNVDHSGTVEHAVAVAAEVRVRYDIGKLTDEQLDLAEQLALAATSLDPGPGDDSGGESSPPVS